jgi:chromosome segregation protein
VEELRARRRSAALGAEVASGAHRAAEDRRRRTEVALGIDEERLAAVDAATMGVAEAADVSRRALSGTSAELAAARDADASAADALAALETAETDERRRLVGFEADAAAARDRLRRAEERARGAEVTEMEARLGLDAVRESFLVELAGLGAVGLVALRSAAGEMQAAAEHVDPDDDAFAVALEAALEAAILAWTAAGPTSVAATAPEPPSPGRQAALRRRYHELGASNPFAAEEHAAVRDRLADLESQQDDLLAAIGGTRQLIAELTQRIAEQFQATFVALEGAFARRFEQLFDGGEASLLLTEPEALTQSGVEIMARPPGKKRQALAMLSGGERALTAVALLFAILEVRPVPFCVLDEVDAALDEANVTRFATALRELAGGTQFIVITHNRGTIESADALYGVTIGDDAVSRVISLRLDEASALVAATG